MGPNKPRKKKTPTKPRETLVAKNRRLDKERDEKIDRVRREQEALMGVDAKRIKETAPRRLNTGGARRSSQTNGDKDRKAAGLKRNQDRAAASRNRTASGENSVSASPGSGAANSSTKPAKAPGTGGKPNKAPEERGFFKKLGDGFKKATTTTPGRPRKPSGKKPMRTPSTGPWAKYDRDMKAFRKKQEAAKGKASGGRVTAKKPAPKGAIKSALGSALGSGGVMSGARQAAKKPTAKKPTAKKPTTKKPMARTSVKKRMPRRP